MTVGYPGVKGSPTDPGPREKTTEVRVLGSDAVNSLVQHPNGDIEVVDNKRVKR